MAQAKRRRGKFQLRQPDPAVRVVWAGLIGAALAGCGHPGESSDFPASGDTAALPSFASPPPVDRVLNTNFTNLDFSAPALVSGTALQAGAVYRYDNVITVSGTRVDADVTVVSLGSCNFGSFDDDTNPARYEPTIRCTADSGITLRFDFFDAARQPVALVNFAVTGVDIDGSGAAYREFHEITGFSSYVVNNPTGLTISTLSSGWVRFLGISNSLNGIQFDNSASYIARYEVASSTFSVRLGNSGNTSNNDRLFSMSIGNVGGVFTTPRTTNAPSVARTTATPTSYGGQVTGTATFSEIMTGFTEPDLTLSAGTVVAGSLATSDGGRTWTFRVTPSSDDPIVVQVPAVSARGNTSQLNNTASNALSIDVVLDSDNDGLLNETELAGSGPLAGFGPTNPFNADSDGDGIQEGTEVGLTAPQVAAATNAALFVADLHSASRTNPNDADTDDGGINDGAEDLNRNGRVDVGERDPNVTADDDSDGDGLTNANEIVRGTNPFLADTDGVGPAGAGACVLGGRQDRARLSPGRVCWSAIIFHRR